MPDQPNQTQDRDDHNFFYWHADMTVFWLVVIDFIIIVGGTALTLLFESGIVAWVLLVALLILAWALPVIILVPRDSPPDWEMDMIRQAQRGGMPQD